MAKRQFKKQWNATKYHNQKVTVDGIEFDSTHEKNRYLRLKMMQSAGMIHGLELQKKFVLIPTQREPDTIGKRGGKHKGKVIERECAYYADFCYFNADGDLVVEDAKSDATKTEQYKIKRKLMLYVHGIRITEV
jgi:hypothetical protein